MRKRYKQTEYISNFFKESGIDRLTVETNGNWEAKIEHCLESLPAGKQGPLGKV